MREAYKCPNCGCEIHPDQEEIKSAVGRAIDKIMGNLAETDISDRDFRYMKDVCEEIRKGTK